MSDKDDFSMLFQYVFDTLFYSAISIECKRVFSSTKKLIISERNQLKENMIKICECLKA
jgi:hypothetical protein